VEHEIPKFVVSLGPHPSAQILQFFASFNGEIIDFIRVSRALLGQFQISPNFNFVCLTLHIPTFNGSIWLIISTLSVVPHVWCFGGFSAMVMQLGSPDPEPRPAQGAYMAGWDGGFGGVKMGKSSNEMEAFHGFSRSNIGMQWKNVDILIHRNFQRHVLMIC